MNCFIRRSFYCFIQIVLFKNFYVSKAILNILWQDDINDFPIDKPFTLHLDSKRIAFHLTANTKAIDTAVAERWFFTITTLSYLLLKFCSLFFHDLLHLAFDHCIDITALNNQTLNQVFQVNLIASDGPCSR